MKLYTSLGAKKLASFLDADEEELVQEMMVLKQASRSISRVAGSESTSLLDGQTITTSDLNFVIDEVRFDFSSILFLKGSTDERGKIIRTWFTSLNQRLVDVTLAGSSKTQRGRRRFLTTLKICLCLLLLPSLAYPAQHLVFLEVLRRRQLNDPLGMLDIRWHGVV